MMQLIKNIEEGYQRAAALKHSSLLSRANEALITIRTNTPLVNLAMSMGFGEQARKLDGLLKVEKTLREQTLNNLGISDN